MDLSNLKAQIKEILLVSKPFIQKLVDEKIIPSVKTFAYRTLQKKADTCCPLGEFVWLVTL